MTSDSVAALTNANSFYQEYQKDLRDLDGKVPLLYVVRQDWKDVVPEWSKKIHLLRQSLSWISTYLSGNILSSSTFLLRGSWKI